MIAIPSRHRSVALLGAMLIAQVLLLAAQIQREQQVRLIRVWAVELIAPVELASSWSIRHVKSVWSGYIGLRHTRGENLELRRQLAQLQVQNAELQGRASEADRLAVLLDFRESHAGAPMLAAQVVGASPDATSHILFLNRGSRDGVKRDMGVITPDGVVGKILAVYPHVSQVLLLSDKDSGVGALLASTRTQGPVKGSGDPLLDMEYVSKDEKVTAGDTVLTSGEDHIFPKDLPVGTVVQMWPDPHSPFLIIRVRPAAHLDQLEEVLILLTRQDLNPPQAAEQSASSSTPTASPAAPAASEKPAAPPAPQ
ncbi:MAG: rod shape-determining protein MreC [Candidatus Acidiferrales bacterium]